MSYGSKLHSIAPKPPTVLTGFGERPAAQYFHNKLQFRGNITSSYQKVYGTVQVGTCTLANAVLALTRTSLNRELQGQV